MLATPGQHVGSGQDGGAESHQLNHRPAVAGALQDLVGDQGDRFRVVEAQPAGAPAPGQLGGSEDRQALQFGGG